MDIISKLSALNQIYSIYEGFVAPLDVACRKYCAHCCTTGVTLTTLEGYRMIQGLISSANTDAVQKIQRPSEIKRFRPKFTTNHLAQLCAEGIDPPEEDLAVDWEDCPFLAHGQCSLYDLRPFGCRCLASQHNCGEKGYAEIDDFVLSVNTVFLQTIEHVDTGGCSGNLLDILHALSSERHRQAYSEKALDCSSRGLISNRRLKVLMIPPEHRKEIEPLLQKFRQIHI